MSGESPFDIGPVSSAVNAPLYQQVINGVMREIAAGRLCEGDALPSVRALATELLVSVITIKRAYEELERADLIYSRQGIGAFVAKEASAALHRDRFAAVETTLAQAIAEARAAQISDADLIRILRNMLKDWN